MNNKRLWICNQNMFIIRSYYSLSLRWWKIFVAQVSDFDVGLFSELDGLVVELSSSF